MFKWHTLSSRSSRRSNGFAKSSRISNDKPLGGPGGVTCGIDTSGNGTEGTKSRLVVLSGHSGSGKSTIVNRLVERAPVRRGKEAAATSRASRAWEAEGQDYYFMSPAQFVRRRLGGEF